MKKIIYVLILPLVVVSGLVFTFGQFGLKPSGSLAPFASGSGATRELKNETSKKFIQRPLTEAESKAELEKWEASPDGIAYKKWEASPAGQKVNVSAAKISKSIREFTTMEVVVTSLSLPPGSRLGFGLMVGINGADYILSFGLEKSNEFQHLRKLKVNDKISIKSHNISQAPKYAYPILSGDYVEQNSKILYKRPASKDGC
jgi:hypothetical protein